MDTLIQCLKKLSVICLLYFISIPAFAFILSNGDEVQCHFSYDGVSGIATEIWNA